MYPRNTSQFFDKGYSIGGKELNDAVGSITGDYHSTVIPRVDESHYTNGWVFNLDKYGKNWQKSCGVSTKDIFEWEYEHKFYCITGTSRDKVKTVPHNLKTDHVTPPNSKFQFQKPHQPLHSTPKFDNNSSLKTPKLGLNYSFLRSLGINLEHADNLTTSDVRSGSNTTKPWLDHDISAEGDLIDLSPIDRDRARLKMMKHYDRESLVFATTDNQCSSLCQNTSSLIMTNDSHFSDLSENSSGGPVTGGSDSFSDIRSLSSTYSPTDMGKDHSDTKSMEHQQKKNSRVRYSRSYSMSRHSASLHSNSLKVPGVTYKQPNFKVVTPSHTLRSPRSSTNVGYSKDKYNTGTPQYRSLNTCGPTEPDHLQQRQMRVVTPEYRKPFQWGYQNSTNYTMPVRVKQCDGSTRLVRMPVNHPYHRYSTTPSHRMSYEWTNSHRRKLDENNNCFASAALAKSTERDLPTETKDSNTGLVTMFNTPEGRVYTTVRDSNRC